MSLVSAFFDLGPHLAKAGMGVRSGPNGVIGDDRGVWLTQSDAEGAHLFVAANYKRPSAAKARADAVQATLVTAGVAVVRVSHDTVQVSGD
jgi:hypothetical protein